MSQKLFLLSCCVLLLALSGTNTAFGVIVWEGNISDGGDDVEEHSLESGNIDSGSSDLEMPYDDGGYPGDPQLIGIRFQNVGVPAGVTIESAYIQFTADNENLTGNTVNIAIWGWKEPNPQRLGSAAYTISSAPRTSAVAKWSNLPDWTSGQSDLATRTSDISNVIEELVNQVGWASGNSIAFIIGDDPDNPSDGIRSVLSGNASIYVEFSSKKAFSPEPANGVYHWDTWAPLVWKPGETAASHDVYFSDNLADVTNGTADAFLGNQPMTSIAVGFPGFPYPEGLIPGTTYYWRIDEVEADGTTKHQGNIWSFTIPPKTAYNPNPADGAEFVDPNATFSWTAGFGAKLHTVYLGNNLDEVSNATGAPPLGSPKYTPAQLETGKIYYWRVDEFDGAAWLKGQIWSFTTPGAVGNPRPANNATGVQMMAKLSWTPADNASSHQLYFGTEKDAVENATTASPEYIGTRALGSESYDPGKLAWFSPYYWRVDEVYNTDPANPVKGLVWSFTTADFILVDDFDSYNDIDPPDPQSNRIFESWSDGYGTNDNGALIGNDLPPYTSQTIVHEGIQSMPYYYNNSFKTSEATMTLVDARDWTDEGVTKLSLWFRGASANAAEKMYIALNGTSVVYHSDPAATQATQWTEWVIDLTEFTGVNLTNVNTFTIGFGTMNSPAAGGEGTMYFDSIRLYP